MPPTFRYGNFVYKHFNFNFRGAVLCNMLLEAKHKVDVAVPFVIRNVIFMILERIFKFGRIPSKVLANVLQSLLNGFMSSA